MKDLQLGTDIDRAARHLSAGELVAIPTETVYGLAANALDETSVARIFKAKNRPHFDPLIVHSHSFAALLPYLGEIPPAALKLAESYWPGPLTLLLPRNERIPDLVTAGLPRVAVRVPRHPLTLELLVKLPFPLAAPSANPFGYISPTRPRHVLDQLADRVSYVLDGGPCAVGLESTIIGFEPDGEPLIYRRGGLPTAALEATLGRSIPALETSTSQPQAPGTLHSHYAPRVPLLFGDPATLIARHHGKRLALLSFGATAHDLIKRAAGHISLSPRGDSIVAAARLFAALRELDRPDRFDLIIAEPLPEDGVLAAAVNDRLRRAAAHG
ncbi:MAG: L-threonylcarbamoyladenylate synthase [Saprospiraceae bacterium]